MEKIQLSYAISVNTPNPRRIHLIKPDKPNAAICGMSSRVEEYTLIPNPQVVPICAICTQVAASCQEMELPRKVDPSQEICSNCNTAYKLHIHRIDSKLNRRVLCPQEFSGSGIYSEPVKEQSYANLRAKRTKHLEEWIASGKVTIAQDNNDVVSKYNDADEMRSLKYEIDLWKNQNRYLKEQNEKLLRELELQVFQANKFKDEALVEIKTLISTVRFYEPLSEQLKAAIYLTEKWFENKRR